MVVTSKALGLALLSSLALAAPFEDSTTSLNARNADALAEALLADEFEFGTRDAEPEVGSTFDSEDLIAREADFEFDDQPIFEVREAGDDDDDDEKPKKKKKKSKKLTTKQKLREWKQLRVIKKALANPFRKYRSKHKKGTWKSFAKSIPKSMRRMARRNRRLRSSNKSLRKKAKKLTKKMKSWRAKYQKAQAYIKMKKQEADFKKYLQERDGKKAKRDALAEPEAWAMPEPFAYASPFAYAEAEAHPIPEADNKKKDENKDKNKDKKKDEKKEKENEDDKEE